MGGKTRIAKDIAQIINAARGDGQLFWDPFCGALSVSVRLAAHGPGIVSDACAPLISMYRSILGGWDPPRTLSEDEHKAARDLPDTDPIKAFAGFGCSFGGRWFGSYARSGGRNFAESCRNTLLRDVPKIRDCWIDCMSFFDVEPRSLPLVIYCDPPYAGTAGYDAVGPFNHWRFWRVCQAWESHGVPVFVSEIACPVPHEVVWSKDVRVTVTRHKKTPMFRTEKLFRVRS